MLHGMLRSRAREAFTHAAAGRARAHGIPEFFDVRTRAAAARRRDRRRSRRRRAAGGTRSAPPETGCAAARCATAAASRRRGEADLHERAGDFAKSPSPRRRASRNEDARIDVGGNRRPERRPRSRRSNEPEVEAEIHDDGGDAHDHGVRASRSEQKPATRFSRWNTEDAREHERRRSCVDSALNLPCWKINRTIGADTTSPLAGMKDEISRTPQTPSSSSRSARRRWPGEPAPESPPSPPRRRRFQWGGTSTGRHSAGPWRRHRPAWPARC